MGIRFTMHIKFTKVLLGTFTIYSENILYLLRKYFIFIVKIWLNHLINVFCLLIEKPITENFSLTIIIYMFLKIILRLIQTFKRIKNKINKKRKTKNSA